MKNWIKKWLGIDKLNINSKMIVEINRSLQNRRQEIDGLIESFQNLDNNEVIRDLHLRIEKLENDKGIK